MITMATSVSHDPLTGLHPLVLDVTPQGSADVGIILHHEVMPLAQCGVSGIGITRDQVEAEVGLIVGMSEQTGIAWRGGASRHTLLEHCRVKHVHVCLYMYSKHVGTDRNSLEGRGK